MTAPPRPIKVAHVITRLILGGAQENTLYTAIGQHRDPRFDVTLICGVDEAGEGDLFEQVKAAGVKLVIVPSLVRPIRPTADVRAAMSLLRLFRRGRFDVVHTHSSKAGIIGRLAARAAGVPIVVHTLHSLVFHEYQAPWKNTLYVRLKRWCAPLTDTLISVNEQTSKGALAAGIGRPEQYVTIFSGMDLELFLSVRDRLSVGEAKARLGLPPDALVVGKVARFFPLKGHEQFMMAAARIAEREPRARFLLVGDGPLRETIEAEISQRGLRDRFVLTGRVPPDAVPACLQAMDVVVHTSLREGIARVLPQAGAVGKPVVTFDLDGAPEVIRQGSSGYLVPPLDTDALANYVVDLLNDPSLRTAFGARGRTFAAENFGLETMVDRISQLYLDLIAKRSGIVTDRSVPLAAEQTPGTGVGNGVSR
jgi:glycosyltransferase involved in cell wall biosynthesis